MTAGRAFFLEPLQACGVIASPRKFLGGATFHATTGLGK
jgi:hypothetical protein